MKKAHRRTKNVLVTGGNGFVGWNLTKALLEHSAEVTCLVRRTANIDTLKPLPVKIAYYDDVADKGSIVEAVARKTAVFHVAGCVRTFKKERLFQINEGGTRTVTECCAIQPNPPVLTIVSSLAAYGPARSDVPKTELDLPQPISDYGRSKLACEMAAREWSNEVPITIVRPPIILGPGDRDGLGIFKCISRLRVHFCPGSKQNRYSIIHAADLAKLLILAAERGTRLLPSPTDREQNARGTYFVEAEKRPTYAEFGHDVSIALDRRLFLNAPIQLPVIWTVAAVSDVLARLGKRPNYLNVDKAKEITAGSWICSSQAAMDDLGFSVDAPLQDRLHQTVQWYREQGWL